MFTRKREAFFTVETRKNFYRVISFLALISALFFVAGNLRAAEARSSRAWTELLSERTATLWIEGELLGDSIILNARGELNVTWLENRLANILNTDDNVEEWVVNSLSYYFSNRRETRAKTRGRDILVLNYRAVKRWNFDPTNLTVNGYAITRDDILTLDIYWESELLPGDIGTVAVAVPSLRPGQTVELRFEDARATLEIPRLRAR
jgi:hypothetical protein